MYMYMYTGEQYKWDGTELSVLQAAARVGADSRGGADLDSNPETPKSADIQSMYSVPGRSSLAA
jgi:hypothetical protein